MALTESPPIRKKLSSALIVSGLMPNVEDHSSWIVCSASVVGGRFSCSLWYGLRAVSSLKVRDDLDDSSTVAAVGKTCVDDVLYCLQLETLAVQLDLCIFSAHKD
ncbi:hypothetical protein HC256_008051 [Beauveria bassiana]|nr:hypothetical protein HC256_008051 [Beauveria bassiana]